MREIKHAHKNSKQKSKKKMWITIFHVVPLANQKWHPLVKQSYAAAEAHLHIRL